MRDQSQTPTTRIMSISNVRSQLNSLVNTVYQGETRVVVEKSGIPVAGLVSADDLRRLNELDNERAARFAVVDEVRAAFADVSDEEIEAEAERAIAEVRGERRAGVSRQ
jgi:prevent-host-death family protein